MFNINIEYAMSNWLICQACIQRFIANLATDIRIVFWGKQRIFCSQFEVYVKIRRDFICHGK